MSNNKNTAMMKSNVGRVKLPNLRLPEFRNSAPWNTKLGGEVFDQVNNKEHNADLPVLAVTQEHGAIPRDLIDYHVSVADASIEGYKVVEVGDFIISLRSFQGGVEFSEYRGICSPAYVILRLKNENSKDYFRHYLKTDRFIRQLTKNLEGLRDGKMISYKQFSELHLAIPSRPEQQCIADCLSSLDELIEAEEKKLKALRENKMALVLELFPQKAEAVPRLRFPEFQCDPPWVPAKLSDVAAIQSGGTPARTIPAYWGGDIPWVTTSLIDAGIILEAEEFITQAGLKESSAKVFPRGTLLMAMYGQGQTRGKVAILGIAAATNQACAAILLKSREVSSNFVFQSLSGRYKEIREISNSGGQANLSAGLIENIPVSYPRNKDEQDKISLFLSSLDDLVRVQAQRVEQLRVFKNGLMQQLFPALNEVQE